MVEEPMSKYTVTLNQESQRNIELKNLEDLDTDVYLVPLTEAVEFISSQIDENKEVVFDPPRDVYDQETLRYSGVSFSKPEQPQLVVEENAYPCSVTASWDNQGHFVVVHTPHSAYLLSGRREDDTQRYITARDFIESNMVLNKTRIVVSGTNMVEPMQSDVFNSIKENIGMGEIEVENLFVADRKFEPNSKALSSEDAVTGVIFIPGEFSKDGKQKVIFFGVNKSDFDAVEDISVSKSLKQKYLNT